MSGRRPFLVIVSSNVDEAPFKATEMAIGGMSTESRRR
jgi:hypothetical protein